MLFFAGPVLWRTLHAKMRTKSSWIRWQRLWFIVLMPLRDEAVTLFIILLCLDIQTFCRKYQEHHEHVLSFRVWLLKSLCRIQDLLARPYLPKASKSRLQSSRTHERCTFEAMMKATKAYGENSCGKLENIAFLRCTSESRAFSSVQEDQFRLVAGSTSLQGAAEGGMYFEDLWIWIC